MNNTSAARLRTLQWSWLLPVAAAVSYPTLLAMSHAAGGGSPYSRLGLLLGAFLVPVSGMLALFGLERASAPGGRLFVAKRASTLVVAAPPMYTLMGVLLYLMKINGHDNAVWCAMWCVLAAGFGMQTFVSPDVPAPQAAATRHVQLRAAHGIVSLFVLAIFLAPHLFNHLLGLLGTDTHRSVMLVLRKLYRAGLVEPVVIAAFFFQVVSGLVLLRHRTARKNDLFGVLQIASGAYLAVFIVGHINSVFTLARYAGTETDYAWATGAPAGLLGDAWNIRLLPHYCLAVFFVLAHLAGGLRIVMLAHGAARPRADRITWVLVALAACAALAISAGMLGVRL